MKTKVSVVIPTYNRSRFLLEAIDSVIKQTFVEFELIVVDDGSVDDTRAIVEKICDGRVKYINKEHGGVSSARNVGISVSKAPLISFLDSDDLWLPKKLEVQVKFFENDTTVYICQTEEVWIRNGKRVNPAAKHEKHSGWIFEKCLPLCIVSPSAVMMRRKVFDRVGTFDEDLSACEDYDLWLRSSLVYPIYTLQDALIVKRGGHDDQLSKAWGLDIYRIRALQKLFKNRDFKSEYKDIVCDEIQRRATIVMEGALKRKNEVLIQEMKCILERKFK